MKRITIATESGSAHVDAVVYGAWAAHQRWNWNRSSEDWTITHIDSGLCIQQSFSPEDAVAAAERLELSGLHTLDDLRGQGCLVEALIAEVIA